MIVILKCAIFIHFQPNLIHWIASNTNLMKAPNTNFTKFVKNWFVQIKFFQILPKCHYYKSKYHQIHPGTPKYWDFGSFFSICEYQMLSLGQEPPVLQGSNLEMVDRGLLDGLPDILETWNLKCSTSRPPGTFRKCVRDHLPSKDPTWRWWIGAFLMDFLTS